jgi:hypothetical protein
MAYDLTAAERQQFIQAAEAAIRKNGTHALRGAESFLDPDHWVSFCENNRAQFHNQYDYWLDCALMYMLARPGEPPPAIVDVLASGELESRFPQLNLAEATFAQAALTINYILARLVVGPPEDARSAAELEGRTDEAFRALWVLPGAQDIDSKEHWVARQVLLGSSFGRYEEVLRAFDERHRYDMAAYEGSDRTIVKECYLLAHVAIDQADADQAFGVRALFALLRFQYYLGLVNQDREAQIDLVSLILMCQLHGKVVEDRTLSVVECVSLLQPRAVVEEMVAIKSA